MTDTRFPADTDDPDTTAGAEVLGPSVSEIPREALADLEVGAVWEPDPAELDAVGRTMFDVPGSKDNTVTVLLPKDQLGAVPNQSLLRIWSREDDRTYLGIVTAGPFAEPDGLRADAPTVVTTAVRGANAFVPRYHGRIQVEILGEQLDAGLAPPRFRPLPNSPVFALDAAESTKVLKLGGNLRLGVVAGDDALVVDIPGDRKSVLPRHTGVLGTTGGGKSTTVSRLIDQAQRQGFAVILLDTEGEYTHLNETTEDPTMLALWARVGQQPAGVQGTRLYHLVGRETTNTEHPDVQAFDICFDGLSPYVVEELLNLSDAQRERFTKAYDLAKDLLRRFGVFPTQGNREEEQQALELNEFETGYPRMRLDHVLDVAKLLHDHVDKADLDDTQLLTAEFIARKAEVIQRVKTISTSHVLSWRALLGSLWRMRKLKVFDRDARLDYAQLIEPGRVSIFDLSDTDSPTVNNLVIADMLRGVQRCQDLAYARAERSGGKPTPVLIVIEEAHEFLSSERISKMPTLFEQVARIAKRGRKRWLGLVFVTQLPQHLPRQVLGLVNNFVLHKISDADTISQLKRSIAGIDDSLWQRLPGLAPGQAIVSFTSMNRPLLVAIGPTPAKLRMLD
jgi:hypothetical protein